MSALRTVAKGPAKKLDVVECLTRQRLGHIPRRFSVHSEHNDPGVVILHRQSPIIFRALHFASVPSHDHKAPRDGTGTCEYLAVDIRCVTCIDQHRRLVAADDVDDGLELDLADPAGRAPRRNAELIPADIGISGGDQLFGNPPALAAVRTVAVEDQRRGLVATDQPPDLGDVRDELRHRNAWLGGDIQRPGDVADRELAGWPHIQDGRASRQQDRPQRLGRDLGRARGLPSRWTLGRDERGACHGSQHSRHELPDGHFAPHISLRCRPGCGKYTAPMNEAIAWGCTPGELEVSWEVPPLLLFAAGERLVAGGLRVPATRAGLTLTCATAATTLRARQAMHTSLRPPRVRFGRFELDPVAGELFRRGTRVRLQEQPLQVLIALLERPGSSLRGRNCRSACGRGIPSSTSSTG